MIAVVGSLDIRTIERARGIHVEHVVKTAAVVAVRVRQHRIIEVCEVVGQVDVDIIEYRGLYRLGVLSAVYYHRLAVGKLYDRAIALTDVEEMHTQLRRAVGGRYRRSLCTYDFACFRVDIVR